MGQQGVVQVSTATDLLAVNVQARQAVHRSRNRCCHNCAYDLVEPQYWARAFAAMLCAI